MKNLILFTCENQSRRPTENRSTPTKTNADILLKTDPLLRKPTVKIQSCCSLIHCKENQPSLSLENHKSLSNSNSLLHENHPIQLSFVKKPRFNVVPMPIKRWWYAKDVEPQYSPLAVRQCLKTLIPNVLKSTVPDRLNSLSLELGEFFFAPSQPM